MKLTSPSIYLGVGVTALGAVGLALVSQHRFGMEPCPWCILQRLLFVVVGLMGLVAWVSRPRALTQSSAAVALVATFSGIAAGLYQNLVASKSASCNLTLADRIVTWTTLDRLMPEVFEVRASCADAAVKLLGVPYELWSVALFALLALALVWALRQR